MILRDILTDKTEIYFVKYLSIILMCHYDKGWRYVHLNSKLEQCGTDKIKNLFNTDMENITDEIRIKLLEEL